ncbi:hypothetical protein Tco_1578258 [Tanacetum coccineum]
MASTQDSSSNLSKKIKLTIILPRQLFINISNDEDVATKPSPIKTSSSPSPPNARSKTPSTKDNFSTFGTTSSLFESKPQSSPPFKRPTNETSSSQENTSSSFQSKLKISPPSSNEPTSPQPLNPLLENISDVPPRPSNPQPLQSHLFLDITLSLSLFENLETPSPPSHAYVVLTTEIFS